MSSGRTSPDEVLAAYHRIGMAGEPVTTSEIAEELGCDQRIAVNNLEELAEKGVVKSKEVDAQSRIWWRPADSGESRSEIGAHVESELEEIFGRISDAFYALDTEWQFTYVSDYAKELIDYRGEGLVGKNLWEVFEWAEDSTLGEEYRTAMETQEPTSFEFYYPDPLDAWYEVYAYPSETGLSVYFRDVTERKRRERTLTESERRYRTLAEYFPNGIVTLFDHDLRYTLASGRGFENIPVEPSDLEGKQFDEVWDDETAEALKPAFEAALDGEQRAVELEYVGREWVVHAVPITDERGDVFAGITMAQDITERKARERELQRYREYTDKVLDAIDDVFYILDDSGTLQRWNDTLCDVTGYRSDEVESMHALEFFDDEDQDEIADAIRDGFETGHGHIETEIVTKAGDRIPYEFIASALEDPDGERVLAGIGRDITDQKEREQTLQDAKDQLEAATEAGAVGTWEWNIQDDEFVAGTSFARTFGVDPEAAREGVSLDRLLSSIHEDDRERVEHAIENAMESCGEYEEEYRVWNADDELRWVVARGHVECDDDGTPVRFPGALTDITDHKRTEQELAAQRKQLETLFEVLPVGVMVADGSGDIIEANEAAKDIWGVEEFDAETVAEYEQYRAWWADTGEQIDPKEWTLARVLRGEEVEDPDIYEIETADGERRTIMAHGMPIWGADAEVSRGVATLTDITERREYQHQLEESNERLESFASMLAHELRNPVTIGQIYSDQLPDETDAEAVEYVTEAFDRIEDMIEVMLILTRGRDAVGERTPMQLADAAWAAWDQAKAPEVALEVEVDQTIQADETYIKHLFRNLFENAVEHGGRDVTITVGELPDGFYVADNGVGIPADEGDAVFEAGYTTAAEEGGTGLGLAFVQKLADIYDWECTVTESADGGARFEFTDITNH